MAPEAGALWVTRGGSRNDGTLLCPSANRSKNAQDSRVPTMGAGRGR